MAQLGDFFAKRDKKKGRGKKFTTTDEIAKKLEETGKKVEKPAEQKPKKERGKPEEEGVYDIGKEDPTDEWKEYHEEGEKDYSGLKIQKLNINEAEDEPEQQEGESGEGDSNTSKNVWKISEKEEIEDQVQQEPEPEPEPVPEPVKEEEPTKSAAETKSAYVPPNRRLGRPEPSVPTAAQRVVRGRPRVAPDINSEEFFPTLSSQGPKTRSVAILAMAKKLSEMKRGVDTALAMLRSLPRVGVDNIASEPGTSKKRKIIRGTRAKHHLTRGEQSKPMRLGFEPSKNPFVTRFQKEQYYKGHHLRREYAPMSLQQLQLMIDTSRIDPSEPVDLAQIYRTKLFRLDPNIIRYFGIQLTDDGMDNFAAKVNVEVQYAPEHVIAAVERNGGIITTAFYDQRSLQALGDAEDFFKRGFPIPRRQLPPFDAVEYYTNPKNRGYLADPAEIAKERFLLSQKYGYELPVGFDPKFLGQRKHPRQVFYGLEPGWVVSLKDRCIFKPEDEELKEIYQA
ncbi:unnamed protein product [Notodromas monacha]|uniref:Large ribosomal subunit protein uL15m n=1 Tax=Notodromas monacha TaxID=399045 RepID=A0A7R9GIQ9_9CRUS|nr:unnamed protein product [Notodromas monacha]CAG0922730.1 unnamed protein product [Notodromas monacha]